MGLAKFGAHSYPPTSSYTVPRARLGTKEALAKVKGDFPASAPQALSSACACSASASALGPLLCLQHVCAPWARLCAPCPASPKLLCLGFFVLSCPDNREGGQRVCCFHPPLLIIHLQTDPLQTPRTCSPALPAGRPSRCCSRPAHGCCQRKAQTSASRLPSLLSLPSLPSRPSLSL